MAVRHRRASGLALSASPRSASRCQRFWPASCSSRFSRSGSAGCPPTAGRRRPRTPWRSCASWSCPPSRWAWCRGRSSRGTSAAPSWTCCARTTCALLGPRGCGRCAALVRHGLRNASVPVVTVLGLQLATLLIGAVVVERVFVMPGLGSLLLDSVANRDLIVVQDVVMLLVVAVLAVNFVVDLLYVALTRASGPVRDEHRAAAVSSTRPAAVRAHGRMNPSLVVGGVLVLAVVLTALLSFVWTPYDPTARRLQLTGCSSRRRSTGSAPTSSAATCFSQIMVGLAHHALRRLRGRRRRRPDRGTARRPGRRCRRAGSAS